MIATIVHLSDIHFSEHKNFLQPKVRALAAAICSTEPTCSEYVIVISGDIANAGRAEEYAVAKRFIDGLSDAMGEHRPGVKVHFLFIPGNHDCYLPEKEIELRAVLVAGIQATFQASSPDQSMLELLLDRQRGYFEFQTDQGHSAATVTDKLVSRSLLDLGGGRLRFTLYNTAVLSTRKEQQGELAVPMGLIGAQVPDDDQFDLAVSVFHHPYSWLQSDVGIAFRDQIERTSDLALTGHQHVDHAYAKETIARTHIFYSEGEVLQDPDAHDRSGFRVIHIDLPNKSRRVVTYTWDRKRYSSTSDTEWNSYTRTPSHVGAPAPAAEFLRILSDSVIGLTHPVKGPVPLDAVFVYPDATSRPLSSADSAKNVGGSRLLPHLTAQTKVIIRGSAYSGKTALAKTVAKEWLRQGSFYPILLSGGSIKQADRSFIDRLVNGAVANAYGKDGVEPYRQFLTP